MKYKLVLLAGLLISTISLPKYGSNTIRSIIGAPNPKISSFSKSEDQSQEVTTYQTKLHLLMQQRNDQIDQQVREYYKCTNENKANFERALKNGTKDAATNKCLFALQEAIEQIKKSKKYRELTRAEEEGKLRLPEFVSTSNSVEENQSDSE